MWENQKMEGKKHLKTKQKKKTKKMKQMKQMKKMKNLEKKKETKLRWIDNANTNFIFGNFFHPPPLLALPLPPPLRPSTHPPSQCSLSVSPPINSTPIPTQAQRIR